MATHSATAATGTRAPVFELADNTGEMVRLAELHADGPLVLSFLRGFL